MSDARASAQSGTPYNGDRNTTYDIQSFTYPADLFSNKAPYGNNWVMININMLEQSKYMISTEKVDVLADRRNLNSSEYKMSGSEATAAIAVGSGIVGAAVGGVASLADGGITNIAKNIFNGKGLGSAVNDVVKKVGGGFIGGAVAGGGVAAVALMNPDMKMNRPVKRIAAAVQLPMPNSMITPYSVDWNADSTKAMDLALRAGMEAVKAAGNASKAGFDLDKLIEVGKNAVDGAKSLGKDAVTGEVVSKSSGLSAATGIASNPKMEMIFQGVDFRNFQMDYTFYPKNAAEALSVKRIIDLLKFHMYPEYKSSERFTFIYPSEFDITFYSGSRENPWVNKVATCVLTNMNVNYTPTSQWVAHEDGSPVMINVTLQFKELSIITKDTLNDPSKEGSAEKANY